MTHAVSSKWGRTTVSLGAVFLAALSGCAGYNSKSKGYMDAYRGGNLDAAVTEVDAHVKKSGDDSQNQLIWLLEAGSVSRAAGKFKESNAYFDQADEVLTKFEDAPDASITGGAVSTMTNQTSLPYRGYPYDGIMLNTYKALNDLALGDIPAARVELNRAYQRQQQAVDKYAKEIEKSQADAKSKNVDSLRNDSKFKGELAQAYGDVDDNTPDTRYAAYKNFTNPLTELLQGIYFLGAGTDANDTERAAKSMERVAGMVSQNPYLAQDQAAASDTANGKRLKATTYVFFETGFAPHRETITIHVPFFASGTVNYAGVAFPKLQRDNQYRTPIRVAANGRVLDTKLVCSMDSVIYADFKNELPIIITNTLISSGAKAGAAFAANQGAKGNGIGGAAVQLFTAGYQAAMNKADERTWKTLPKQFLYCRVATPADRKVQIIEAGGGAGQTITLLPGNVNVVWVKAITPEQPLRISQFALP